MREALLVTGVNGFLASSFLKKYADLIGMDIVAIWRSNKNNCLNSPPENVHYEQCDLTDLEAVQKIFRKYQISKIFHSAAYIPKGSCRSVKEPVSSNIIATANLVECAATSNCSRFVYCSSISVYGETPLSGNGWEEHQQVVPSSYYGWSKYAGEECLRLATKTSEMTGISLRLAGIHGIGRAGGVIFQIMKNALSGKTIEINYPNTPFELLFIDDVIEVIRLAIEAKLENKYECFNVSSLRVPSLEYLSEFAKNVVKSNSSIVLTSSKTPHAELINTDKIGKLLSPSFKNLNEHLMEMREWMDEPNQVKNEAGF